MPHLISRPFRVVAGVLLIMGLLIANVYAAYAHTSSPYYHWHITGKTGVSSVYIGIYDALCSSTACNNWRTAVNNAKSDGWLTISMLDNRGSASHASSSLHVYATTTIGGCGGFYPNTSSSHLWDGHIALSTNNSCGGANDYMTGVACQEIGHGWGLDHSPTGDCMALGYYSPSSYQYSSHNSSDFTGIYYNH